jgi:hypothetical protein
MTKQEWVWQLARIKSLWPDAPAWEPRTIDAYFVELEACAADAVGTAISWHFRNGMTKPPHAGQILKAVDKLQLAAPRMQNDGDGCRCHEVYFWQCPAPAGAHGDEYMNRRRAELRAARAVANCVREGRDIGPGEMRGHDPSLLSMAQMLNWYGCADGRIPAGAP